MKVEATAHPGIFVEENIKSPTFQAYQILIYLTRPERVPASGGERGFQQGSAAAYVFRSGRLVEIWASRESPGPSRS